MENNFLLNKSKITWLCLVDVEGQQHAEQDAIVAGDVLFDQQSDRSGKITE